MQIFSISIAVGVAALFLIAAVNNKISFDYSNPHTKTIYTVETKTVKIPAEPIKIVETKTVKIPAEPIKIVETKTIKDYSTKQTLTAANNMINRK